MINERSLNYKLRRLQNQISYSAGISGSNANSSSKSYTDEQIARAGPNTIEMTAATDLNGNFFVKSSAGLADVPDLAFLADGLGVVGITTGAIATGASGLVQTGGVMTEISWHWTPGGAIYVGALGIPTQTVPSGKWVLQGGIAINTNTIEITLGQVISTPI